jgi:ribosome-associated protein
MTQRKVTFEILHPEITFSTSRSSGPGGQNVNKVNSKVTLLFDIPNSQLLSDDEKTTLLHKLGNKLTNDGVLLVSSQEKRSQLQNKEEVILKFDKLISGAFVRKKARRSTKPTKQSVRKRIQSKKKDSEKKRMRQKPMD